jgi:hypothetical protein
VEEKLLWAKTRNAESWLSMMRSSNCCTRPLFLLPVILYFRSCKSHCWFGGLIANSPVLISFIPNPDVFSILSTTVDNNMNEKEVKAGSYCACRAAVIGGDLGESIGDNGIFLPSSPHALGPCPNPWPKVLTLPVADSTTTCFCTFIGLSLNAMSTNS